MAVPELIATRRLRLEPFEERHLTARYVGWLNDPQVVRFSGQRHRRHTLESCRRYWDSFAGTADRLWAIVAPELGHVGNASAHVREAHGTADVGLLLGERGAWNQGLGTEAWLGVCDHLFRVAGLRKVTGGALASNLPMLRVMQKAGMVEDGRRTAHEVWEERPVDVVHYALFREEWLRRDPASARA